MVTHKLPIFKYSCKSDYGKFTQTQVDLNIKLVQNINQYFQSLIEMNELRVIFN